MNCIKCGVKIPDGEIFCEQCGKKPVVRQPSAAKPLTPAQSELSAARPAPRPAPKGDEAQQRSPMTVRAAMEAAQEAQTSELRQQRQAPRGRDYRFEAERPAAKRRAGRGLLIALIAVSLVAAVSLTYIIKSAGTLTLQRNQLRKAEAEMESRISSSERSEQEIATLQEQLATAQAQADSLSAKVNQLESQLSDNESADSQSQYDRSSQEQELTRVKAELGTMTETVLAYETAISEKDTQISDMTTEKTEMEEKMKELEEDMKSADEQVEELETANSDLRVLNESYLEKVTFMDTYIVFIEDDGTNQYHSFNCSRFKRQTFWVYNKTLAQESGYHACPICMGG